MGGSTKSYDTTPKATQGLRDPVLDWLKGGSNAMGQGGVQPQNMIPTSRPGGTPGVNFGPTGVQQGGPQPNLPPMSQEGPGMTGGGQPPMSQGYPGSAGPDYGVGSPGGSPFDRIFSQMPGGIPRTTLPMQPDVNGYDRNQIRDVGYNPVSYDPSGISRIGPNAIDPSQIPQVGGPNNQLPPFLRNQIGQASAQGTQSIQSLLASSGNPFQKMFDQQRALAVASGKESAGNLTGSGFANTVGANLGRTLGEQDARVADYALAGATAESGRQGNDANRFLQASIANQGGDTNFLNLLMQQRGQSQQGELANQDSRLRALLANQSTGLQGQMANQGVDSRSADQRMNALLANQDAGIHTGLANQGVDQTYHGQDLQRRLANRDSAVGQVSQQGQMDQQRQIQEYITRAQSGDANASRFLQMLLAQSTAGVGPSTVVHSPGLGQQLLQAGTQLGAAALGGCWVAEELYGPDDIRTHRARKFVSQQSGPFFDAYRERGIEWAAAVRRNPWVKEIIQPLWDEMAREAA